jgi:hypothetical protein
MKLITFIIGINLLAMPSFADQHSIDMHYLKTVDNELYDLLVMVEQCKINGKSIAECQQEIAHIQSMQDKIPELLAHRPSIEQAPIEKKTDDSSNTSNDSVSKVLPITDWWMKSAYEKGSNSTLDWQNAVLGSLSITDEYGNIDRSRQAASLNYYLRKEVWTNEILVNYSRDRTKQAGYPPIERDYFLFNNNLQYDFNQTWFAEIGGMYQKDTILALRNKYTYYLGFGAYAVNNGALTLKFLSALGRQKETFSQANSSATGLNKFEYNLLYTAQQAQWTINDSLVFNQSLQFSYSLDKLADFSPIDSPTCLVTLQPDASFCISDYDRRIFTTLKFGIEYQINTYLSLSYNLSYMLNSQEFLSDESKQSNHSFGIIVKYQ